MIRFIVRSCVRLSGDFGTTPGFAVTVEQTRFVLCAHLFNNRALVTPSQCFATAHSGIRYITASCVGAVHHTDVIVPATGCALTALQQLYFAIFAPEYPVIGLIADTRQWNFCSRVPIEKSSALLHDWNTIKGAQFVIPGTNGPRLTFQRLHFGIFAPHHLVAVAGTGAVHIGATRLWCGPC